MAQSVWITRGTEIYEFKPKDVNGTVEVFRTCDKIGEIRTVEGGFQYFPIGHKKPTSEPTSMRKIKKEILG